MLEQAQADLEGTSELYEYMTQTPSHTSVCSVRASPTTHTDGLLRGFLLQ